MRNFSGPSRRRPSTAGAGGSSRSRRPCGRRGPTTVRTPGCGPAGRPRRLVRRPGPPRPRPRRPAGRGRGRGRGRGAVGAERARGGGPGRATRMPQPLPAPPRSHRFLPRVIPGVPGGLLHDGGSGPGGSPCGSRPLPRRRLPLRGNAAALAGRARRSLFRRAGRPYGPQEQKKRKKRPHRPPGHVRCGSSPSAGRRPLSGEARGPTTLRVARFFLTGRAAREYKQVKDLSSRRMAPTVREPVGSRTSGGPSSTFCGFVSLVRTFSEVGRCYSTVSSAAGGGSP